jgi:hypothetical protein
MSRRLTVVVLASLAVLALAATPLSSTPLPAAMSISDSSAALYGVRGQPPGRYKQQGEVCEWDAKDTGPNQCEPIVKGRFKRGDKDSCTWDASDVGADQCRPPKGRWKGGKDNSCAWDANDSGPDQCNPRRVKK